MLDIMKEIRGLSILFCISIVLLFLVACSEGEPIPQEGRIYYSLIEKGVSRIEYMDQYGKRIHYVVGDMADEFSEASYSCKREYRKFKEQNEKNGVSAAYPSVSTDGTLMAYVFNSSSIRVINLRDRSEKDFLEAKKDEKNKIKFYSPRLSPRPIPQLAYLGRDGEDYYNVYIKALGSEPTSYFRSKYLSNLCWSNFNDELLLNYRTPEKNTALYSMKTDRPGRRTKKIIDDLHDCTMAPRGSLLAGISQDGQLVTYDIYTKRTMTLVRGGCSSPTWNPRGNVIAFIKDNKIFKINVQGGKPEQLSQTNALINSVCWAVGL